MRDRFVLTEPVLGLSAEHGCVRTFYAQLLLIYPDPFPVYVMYLN